MKRFIDFIALLIDPAVYIGNLPEVERAEIGLKLD